MEKEVWRLRYSEMVIPKNVVKTASKAQRANGLNVDDTPDKRSGMNRM
jgi:hypothetical protein